MSPSSPHMDLDEFEKRAETIFKEYFDHGDPQEVAASLEEFNIRNIKHEVNGNTKKLFFFKSSAGDHSFSFSLSLSHLPNRLSVC